MRQFPFSSSRPLFNTETEHVVYNCGLFSFQPDLFNISSRQGITAHETNEMNHSVFRKEMNGTSVECAKIPTKKVEIISGLICYHEKGANFKSARFYMSLLVKLKWLNLGAQKLEVLFLVSCVLMIPCGKRHSTGLWWGKSFSFFLNGNFAFSGGI